MWIWGCLLVRMWKSCCVYALSITTNQKQQKAKEIATVYNNFTISEDQVFKMYEYGVTKQEQNVEDILIK